MNTLDTIYRAFTDFRKSSSDDRDCAMQRTVVARADVNNDLIETVRYDCHIDEDWVCAIEKGLEFVEKAIAEERQFIRNNGEVVPIEKVKRVSRDSVEHLARHSDMISKDRVDGDDIVPDNLYTVERLSDYAVYENRFLYMLLVYLDRFVSMRYNKIVELANTYRGRLNIDKTVATGTQNLTFKVTLNEERRNDPLLSELNPNKSIIERIAMLLKIVRHYLNTPLMQEVSKSPMIHPPITVTNVLRMNHNFKGALALYEFVSAYDKPGYSAEKHVKKIGPFPDIPADELAEAEALLSFLTYEYGMGVKDVLRTAYQKEEERRKAEEERKKLEKLEALRKRIKENGGNPEEYMLMLERRNRSLESDAAALVTAKQEIERQSDEIAELKRNIDALGRDISSRDERIVEWEQKYADDIARLKDEHAQNINDINAVHRDEIFELNYRHGKEVEASVDRATADYRERIDKMSEEHAAEIKQKDELMAQKDERLAAVVSAAEKEKRELGEAHEKEREQYAQSAREKDIKLEEIAKENKLLAELKLMADARLNALRYKHGYIKDLDEYTTELAFNEIERQYDVFTDFIKNTWKKTKKKIRSEIIRQIMYEGVEQTKNGPKAIRKQKAEEPLKENTETIGQNSADTARTEERTDIAADGGNAAPIENGTENGNE